MRADGCAIFIHLPKTGGRTLAAALRYKYPSRTLFLDSLYEPLERIEEIPLERGAPPGRSPATSTTGSTATCRSECDYITMLRDRSRGWCRCTASSAATPATGCTTKVVGSGMGLEEFVRRAADPTVDNLQTRLRRGRSRRDDGAGSRRRLEQPPPPVTEDDLARAKRNLDRFLVVGLTERFDESFILIRRALGWRLPMYETHNISTAAAGPTESGGDRADLASGTASTSRSTSTPRSCSPPRWRPRVLVPARGGGVQDPEPDPERDRPADTNPLAPPGAGGSAALTATVSLPPRSPSVP